MIKNLNDFLRDKKMPLLFTFIFLLAFFKYANYGLTQSLEEIEIAKTIIWNKEKKIYQSRAINGLAFYIENSSPRYLGWPPGPPSPSNLDKLTESQKNISAPNLEQIEIFFNDFTMHDDTGIIYYNTHRTQMPDGKRVNQRYHVCHIWKRNSDNHWKLLGAMGRLIED